MQSDPLNVVFNTDGDDLAVAGFDGDAGGLSVVNAASTAWGAAANTSGLTSGQLAAISTAIDSIDDAIAT